MSEIFYIYFQQKCNLLDSISYFCSNKELEELNNYNDEKNFVFFPIRFSFLLMCAKEEVR